MTDDEILTLAADPQTPSVVLEGLITIAICCFLREDDRLIHLLAANPNVPADGLDRLAWFVPAVILTNPALPLLDLADPHWLSMSSLRGIARQPGCPAHYLRRNAAWDQEFDQLLATWA